MNRHDMPYRDCVGVALFDRRGLVFVGRRVPDAWIEGNEEIAAPWQMPQGGIDPGEDPYAAALRELYEETSVSSVRLLRQAPGWITYDLPDEALGKALKGRYRGQRQLWFAFLFTGQETEIDVLRPGGGLHPAEFDQWRWERLEALPELIVPFKRQAYLEIVAAFADLPAQLAAG